MTYEELEKEVRHLQNVCRILERALNNALGMDHMYTDAYAKAKEELIQEGVINADD